MEQDLGLWGLLPGLGPSPQARIRDWSRNQAAQGANAIDPTNNPLPPGGPAAGGPAGPAAGGPGGAGPPQAPPEPQAYKTPDTIGNMLMDLQQSEIGRAGFNQGLGMMFAGISQPRDREMVSKTFNTPMLDTDKIFKQQTGGLEFQQNQGRMDALGRQVMNPQQGIQIARALNMPGQTDADKLAALQAAYRSDPQSIVKMIAASQAPTPQMANLSQIERYAAPLKSAGANDKDLQTLHDVIFSGVGGPEAQAMIQDQINYRKTHNNKDAPWADNIGLYHQHLADDAALSKNIDAASGDLTTHVAAAETLRQKISDLQNNNGLKRILAMPQTSVTKNAVQMAIDDEQPGDWRSRVRDAALINDPELMQTISEIRETQGQEYKGAIDSLLGHGLRPSQTEVQAVRSGFGQTKNVINFGSIKDYTAQAINPMLTRLDEAEATAYGAANAYPAMPKRLRPFVHKVYLPGGSQNKEGSGSEDWSGEVHKQMSPEEAADLADKIKNEPANAEWYRDQKRRAGYDLQ